MKKLEVRLSDGEYETVGKLLPLLEEYGKLKQDSGEADVLRFSLRFLASTVQEKINRERNFQQRRGVQR